MFKCHENEQILTTIQDSQETTSENGVWMEGNKVHEKQENDYKIISVCVFVYISSFTLLDTLFWYCNMLCFYFARNNGYSAMGPKAYCGLGTTLRSKVLSPEKHHSNLSPTYAGFEPELIV